MNLPIMFNFYRLHYKSSQVDYFRLSLRTNKWSPNRCRYRPFFILQFLKLKICTNLRNHAIPSFNEEKTRPFYHHNCSKIKSYPWRVCSRESEIVCDVSISLQLLFIPLSRSNIGALAHRAYLVGKRRSKENKKGLT